MASASLLTKTHIFLAFAFAAYFPFTKLIHAWTWPVNYMVRPYQVLRTTALKFKNRWEYGLVSDKSYMTYLAGTVVALLLAAGFLLPGPAIEGGPANIAGKTDTDGLVGGAFASSSEDTAPVARSASLEGYPLYVNQCARCHGLLGKGDGPGANSPTFSATPRDLTKGWFRYVSTENGIASDEDIRRVIVNGLTGSGMPSFNRLSESQIQSLVDVVGVLWKNRPASGDPVAVPPRPASSPQLIAEGRKLYIDTCSACHGPSGRGDGPHSADIKDSAGIPVLARNFVSEPMRGGSGGAQLYRRIAAGMPMGDGEWLMPPLAALGPDNIWAIISYLEADVLPADSKAPPAQPAQRTVKAAR